MSQPVLIKIYGNLTPAGPDLVQRINTVCAQCCPAPEEAPCVVRGDLLTISYEGIYFPVREVVATMAEALQSGEHGKLDELDLENWHLTRYIFASGQVISSSAPLNNVLDYSMSGGH